MNALGGKIGVVGSGTMGAGIAQLAAHHGAEVVVYDSQSTALSRAEQQIDANWARLVEKNVISADEAAMRRARVQFSTSINSLADGALIIEAVVEDLKVKQQLFQQLESVTSEGAVLATNTSSLSIAAIAGACRRPHQVIGLHFFNPAAIMPLVEIVPHLHTKLELVHQVRSLMEQWAKTPVVAKDTPGFIVNRIARPFYGESLKIFEEGIADASTIDWALKEIAGFKMGPFQLMDLIGNDVNYAVSKTVFEATYFDPRYRPSLVQLRMVESGMLGKKTGRGYYSYQEDASPVSPLRNQQLGEQIVDRVVAMLVNEAVDALYFGIASAGDIETAMTKGVNYPRGLLAWGDERGSRNILQVIDDLRSQYADPRYRPSVLLRQRADSGESLLNPKSA